MTGCSDTGGGGGVTSWGWRGDRRLWRGRHDSMPGHFALFVTETTDPCEALGIFIDLRERDDIEWTADE